MSETVGMGLILFLGSVGLGLGVAAYFGRLGHEMGTRRKDWSRRSKEHA